MGEAEWEQLRERMGEHAFKRRQEREAMTTPDEHPNTNRVFRWAKRLDAYAFTSRLASTLRMDRRGIRNFESLVVEHNRITHPELPATCDGFRILQLSDLHLDFHAGTMAALLPMLEGLSYDLAVITGDFQDDPDCPAEPVAKLTGQLLEALRGPVYACLGNHDRLRIVPPLEKLGVRFLLNEGVVLRADTSPPLVICGVEDAYFFEGHDPHRARAGLPDPAFRILLNHAPLGLQAALEAGMHVCLSGHTHGGQICAPGGRPILSLRDIPRHHMAGAWQWGSMTGYTARGVGGCNLPYRFNCPPEITLHTLHSAAS